MGAHRQEPPPPRAQLCTMATRRRYRIGRAPHGVDRRGIARERGLCSGDPRRVRRTGSETWIARAASAVWRHLARHRVGIAGARRGSSATPTRRLTLHARVCERIVTTEARTVRRPPFGLEYKWLVAIVFVCGMFIDIMDTTIVFVATPTLAREFQASASSIEWVVLGYLL